mgnify:CR=1 FL=1
MIDQKGTAAIDLVPAKDTRLAEVFCLAVMPGFNGPNLSIVFIVQRSGVCAVQLDRGQVADPILCSSTAVAKALAGLLGIGFYALFFLTTKP